MSKISSTAVVRTALSAAAVCAGIVVSPVAALLPLLILAFFWRAFETLWIALFLDCLWAPPWHIPFMLIAIIAAVWIFEPVRKEIFL